MYTKLDKTISEMTGKLMEVKYRAIREMVKAVKGRLPELSEKIVRQAIIYYFFD